MINNREVKAFIRRSRVVDVVSGLWAAGFHKLTLVDGRNVLRALIAEEQDYSMAVEIEKEVMAEVKLELVCETETRTAEAVALIRELAKTGQPDSGRIFVSELQTSIDITD